MASAPASAKLQTLEPGNLAEASFASSKVEYNVICLVENKTHMATLQPAVT